MSVGLLEGYKDVLKRGYAKELFATLAQDALTTTIVIVGLYMIKLGADQSRLQIFITDFEEVVKLDCEYIANWTPGLDLRILFKTVAAVLQRKGSL